MTETCKYYLAGTCRNGAQCRFIHADATSTTSTAPGTTTTTTSSTTTSSTSATLDACKYFQRGTCSYGDRCRYAHVRASAPGATNVGAPPLGGSGGTGSGMSARATAFAPGVGALARGLGHMAIHGAMGPGGGGSASGGGGGAWSGALPHGVAHGPSTYGEDEYGDEDEEWGYVDEHGNWVSFEDEGAEMREFLAAQLPDEDELLGLTSSGPSGDDQWGYFDQAGNWVSFEEGVDQYLNHSNEANIDEMVDENAEAETEVDEDASANIECAVCLEVVMNAPRIADRRFGLLNNCDHAFCLSCIRNWREGGVQRGAEASASSNELARACPICRTTSHFITPATTWPRNEEEKTKVTEAYRERLSKIPCRHFDRGDGVCPFGTSCFYEHRYANGELETPEIRKSTAADGSLNILTPVRLSDFLTKSRHFR